MPLSCGDKTSLLSLRCLTVKNGLWAFHNTRTVKILGPLTDELSAFCIEMAMNLYGPGVGYHSNAWVWC